MTHANTRILVGLCSRTLQSKCWMVCLEKASSSRTVSECWFMRTDHSGLFTSALHFFHSTLDMMRLEMKKDVIAAAALFYKSWALYVENMIDVVQQWCNQMMGQHVSVASAWVLIVAVAWCCRQHYNILLCSQCLAQQMWAYSCAYCVRFMFRRKSFLYTHYIPKKRHQNIYSQLLFCGKRWWQLCIKPSDHKDHVKRQN